jgi:alpha-glucosidase
MIFTLLSVPKNSIRISHKIFAFGFAVVILFGCDREKTLDIQSPDASISVEVSVNDSGHAYYTIKRNSTEVMKPSRLGLVREDQDFSKNLSLTGSSSIEVVSDSYEMLYGKKKSFSYTANKKIYHFKNSNDEKLDIIFQVSNDGIAFRYYFPESSDSIKKITQELSSFSFADSARAWIQPRAAAKSGWNATNPSYEENYLQDTATADIDTSANGWVFPALFKNHDSWFLISETAPDRDYCASRLLKGDGANEFVIGFPVSLENFYDGPVFPQSKLPWQTPWRMITIGTLKTIVESTMGTDLAKPAMEKDYSFVKPGRSSWSWVSLKDDSIVYDVQKRFIDYAADMKWEYCLIDVNWDTAIGYDRIKVLADYGAQKNVGIVLWYNSAGNWNTVPYHPRNLLITKESRAKEFGRIAAMGIKGIKVDFFGGDGQSVLTYYQDIIEDAAQFKLMVNCHGSTLPRGLQRTYPNLVSMEAVKGFEFVTFSQGNADTQANHCAMLPFTRNVFDPMDFTPVYFSEIPNILRKTSNAFELALAVFFNSGVQHYADKPQGMNTAPDYVKDLMRTIPVSWEETQFIDGYPGKFAVMARKANGVWYVAGINGELTDKEIALDLPFLRSKKGVLISDGSDNRSFNKTDISSDASGRVPLAVKGNGGFVMVFK